MSKQQAPSERSASEKQSPQRVGRGSEHRSPQRATRPRSPTQAGRNRHELEQDGLVVSLYRYLWLKNSKGKTCPNVFIPQTVIYKYYQPAYWYFTSREQSAQLKQKNKSNVTSANIAAKFAECNTKTEYGTSSGCGAYHVTIEDGEYDPSSIRPILDPHPRRPAGRTVVEHFDRPSLDDFMFKRPKNQEAILQQFIEPRSSQNTILR